MADQNSQDQKAYMKQVEGIMAMAMTVIYNEKVKIEEQHIPEALQTAQQTVKQPDDVAPSAMADVALWVLGMIEDTVESQGKSVPPIVMAGVIGNVVSEVVELSQAAGLVEMSEEDIQVAIAAAINRYIATAREEGKITDEELIQAAQAMEKQHPEEAQAFKDMMQARMQRQGGQQAPQQAQPAQQGLLGGQNA